MSRRGITINTKKALKAAEYKVRSQIRFQAAAKTWGQMNRALSTVMAETPAWSGDTLANYVWGIGSSSSEYRPINQDLFWRNSMFPVGDRSTYESISRSRLNAIRSEVFRDPFRRFVLWNNVRYEEGMTIRDLEYGTLTGTAHLMFTKAKAVLAEG